MTPPQTVLFELGTEELPARAQTALAPALAANAAAGLQTARLAHGAAVQSYATPRRLALVIPAVAAQTAPDMQVRKGPSVQAAFQADGQPTPALLGFVRSCKAPSEQVARWQAGEDRLKTDKGEWLEFRQTAPVREACDLLPDILAQAVDGLPLDKRMRWGEQATSFIRPVRWVVLMYGGEPVPGTIMGLPCGRTSRGHRFLGQRDIPLQDADSYAAALQEHGQVLADAASRRRRITEQMAGLERQLGARAAMPEALLDAACAGTEWPTVLPAAMAASHAALPTEVVTAVLEDQQQYFPMRHPDGGLADEFLIVANVPDPTGAIRTGAERVVRSRLEDAAFYLKQDRLRTLESRMPDLEHVTFHRQLGTMLARTQRIAELAGGLAQEHGADADATRRAAQLCKADLGTDMVQSFPNLQGVMGAHYAAADGEATDVCRAIAEHYRPRHAHDILPRTVPGQLLALADRLDMLAGIFCIGEAPTGSRDPLGVRRAAYGVLRLIVECRLETDLPAWLARACANHPEALRNADAAAAPDAILDYLAERMLAYGSERGYAKDTIRAVLKLRHANLLEAFERIAAVSAFRTQPAARILIETSRRIRNILREAGAAGPGAIDPELLTEPAEQALHRQLDAVDQEVDEDCRRRRYPQALAALCSLAEPVGHFFEQVLVMTDDEKMRHNRIRLLSRLNRLLSHRIADFTRLQTHSAEEAS